MLHTGLPLWIHMATGAMVFTSTFLQRMLVNEKHIALYKASLELHTSTSYRLGLSHMIICSRPPKPPVCPILSAVTHGSLFPIGLLVCNRSNATWLPSHCPRNTALSRFSNGFMLLNARHTSLSLSHLSPKQHLIQLTGFSVLGTGI